MLGILLTLAMIFSIAITNGGLAIWTLNDFFPEVLPEAIRAFTIPQILSIIALYK